jgi:hypothetical protein
MNQLVVSVVVILIPGIIATIISDKLTTHSKWDSFKFSLYALTLGVLSYVVLQVLVYAWNLVSSISFGSVSWTNLKIWGSVLSGGNDISPWEICLAAVLSIPVAFLASWLINYKIFNKIGQKLKVTQKYGDENLYSYYLNAKEIDWVYIRDPESNLTYEGRVVQHSENDKIQELVLSEVSVYRYEDSEYLYSIPTIYLSKEAGKFLIEAIPPERLGREGGTQ